MDFRRRKLWLALTVMIAGMLLALAWDHRAAALGEGYPENTFLAKSKIRYTDFTAVLHFSKLRSPYDDRYACYPAATYPVFHLLAQGNLLVVFLVFFGISLLGLFGCLVMAFRRMTHTLLAICAALAFLFYSYPLIYCLDRGNIEVLLAFSVSAGLLCFRRRWFGAGLACLFPAICFKFYPIALTAVFFRPRHMYRIVLVGLLFGAATLASFLTFDHSFLENLHLMHRNKAFYDRNYVIHNDGLAGSASPWNSLRVVVETVDPALSESGGNKRPDRTLFRLYHLYMALFLAAAAVVVAHILFVEREFFRRIVLLLLLMAISAPSGGDYRLLYVEIALVILILLPSRRWGDGVTTGLLAFALVPKREILLPWLGPTDTQFRDVSIAVVVNSPCILAGIILLMAGAMRETTLREVTQRAWRLWSYYVARFRLRAFSGESATISK